MSYAETHGAEIWRSSTGNAGSWTRVVTNGFGDANNVGVTSFETFNGYLYVGTMNFVTGGEVWRSVSGDQADWAQANTDGFGDAGSWGISALAAFGGYLYAGTGHAAGAGVQLWRCQICDGSDWQKVVDNGCGNPDTRGSPALEVFAGYLHFVVGNPATGLQVWRTQNGTNWEQVRFAGFGNSGNRSPYYDNSVVVFNGRLFVGTVNWVSGGELWSYPNYRVYLPVIVRH